MSSETKPTGDKSNSDLNSANTELSGAAVTSSLTDDDNDAIIHGGPLFRLLAKFGLGHGSGERTALVCLLFVSLTWLPMAILAMVQNVAINSSLKIPFFFDISEMCRFLLCAPLLIVAEKVIEPWLRNVIQQFRALISSEDSAQFQKFIASAVRGRESLIVEMLLLLIAILRPHLDSSITQLHTVPSWQSINGSFSYAQTYCTFVAKTLMGWLWLRWLWKYCLWSLLLVRISTLNLRLIPTHPDDTGGLGFVAVGQTKFTILIAAFSLLAVGAMADDIVFQGATLHAQRWIIVAVICLALVIFTTPLLAFSPKLAECKRKGLLSYGKLAYEYVSAFDQKWIQNRQSCHEEILGHADIQSLADVEGSYSIVQRMKIVILDKDLLTSFILAAALPFAPLVLTVYPLDALLEKVFRSVF